MIIQIFTEQAETACKWYLSVTVFGLTQSIFISFAYKHTLHMHVHVGGRIMIEYIAIKTENWKT